jgi:hypothetical protein
MKSYTKKEYCDECCDKDTLHIYHPEEIDENGVEFGTVECSICKYETEYSK